ncbi:MAG TPA: chemotaxis response regulator protein-glutamate methylesterase [Candidatus Limnocylindrales bacterium]|nr:chemotaxis response regulator protein-glutamate methylesterase [Candidatus Limnocylindrales bacterium]
MAGGSKIRVLVVDDSAFMRKVLHGLIAADPQLEVCGEARDGREAVSQAEALKPDVISMDINMPVMDGLQATEVIMSGNPRPILIVSSESREGAEVTLNALELGAIDFVAKPSGGIDLDMSSVSEELCRKLKMAAKVRVVRTATRSRRPQEIAVPPPRVEVKNSPAENGAGNGRGVVPGNSRSGARFPVVLVAASTGGPATLMKFAPYFAKDFPGAVIVVQHMPGNFTTQFSKQLGEVSQIKVKEAEAGEMLLPGWMYVCPGSHHLRLSGTGRINLDDGPRIGGYRPCADLTFETAADYAGPLAIGVVLTGMGNDGAKGAQAIRAAGGHVIAQDESTAVIFGMPQEAIKSNAVNQILPIETIYAAIEKRVAQIFSVVRVGAQ